MARRVSDRIRLLRLELVETDPLVLELQRTSLTRNGEEQINVDTTHLVPGLARYQDDDEGILLQWLLEIILADSSPWSDEDPYADIVSEGRRIVWH